MPTIAPGFYHIDDKKHLIVINQAVDKIVAGPQALDGFSIGGKLYAFAQPLRARQLTTAASYQVTAGGAMYKVFFTRLPVIHVDARQSIVDAPSVYARFSMTEVSGATTTAKLGIEIRGGFSQNFPKKSYELSFWNDTTGAASRDVQLLNMRTDNKWNLQAMYNEPLRTNAKVSNELWLEMQQIYYKDKEPDAKNGISMAYAELFINDEYKGVYALSERVDRKQLKLKKYSNGIKGELYKGDNWGPGVTFEGAPGFDNANELWAGFEYKEPQEQISWGSLHDFVNFVTTSTDQEFYGGYQQRFRLDNAVDYYILMNLTRAADNRGKNLYIAKYKPGEPYYYVPWDLDGTFGNDWLGQNANVTDDLLSNGFYDRLMRDGAANGFRAALQRRWAELRATVLTEQGILKKFEANNATLLGNNVFEREHLAWDQYTYSAAQGAYVAAWLRSRLVYLDNAFGRPPVDAGPAQPTGLATALYPNPATAYLTVNTDQELAELCIRDVQGRVVLTSALAAPHTQVAIGQLPRGLYVATITGSKSVKTEKLVLN